MNNPVRVRFAPSPTGYLHVGGARTALYDYLYAKKNQGTFVLRVEDTDQERSTEDYLQIQLQALQWLGLNWDEGPDPKTLKDVGPNGPYRQSQRLDIYNQHIEQLLNSGKAFYCFMTDAEHDELKKKAIEQGDPGQINSPYRNKSLNEAKTKIKNGEKPVVRFRVPDELKIYKIHDLVRGEVEFPSNMVGDFVLVRSDGMPVYNFCCVVDDALMKISHVFRAEEHLSNTLRQLMLYEAFDYKTPEFAHVSIILGSDKQKLSKRHGATSVGQFCEMGYLPAAMNNFLALLGWSSPSGEEILSMEQMIREFDLDRLNSSPAVFDDVKLKWVNASHLRALDNKKLWELIQPVLNKAQIHVPQDEDWCNKAMDLFRSYLETLQDAVELFKPLDSNHFVINDEATETLLWESTPQVIAKWKELLLASSEEYLSAEQFSQLQNQVKEQCGVKGKNLFMPIRVAIIGKPHGAELQTLVPLMKKADLIQRAEKVLEKLLKNKPEKK
ncbi:MAG: glutamate--tRNA ligase [Bdellovibrionaceae bacterium]|nr:glutamate--tRNA ligase [Pseudobdellovibrionaceae bacterium]